MTVTVDDVGAAFSAALAKDAGTAEPPEAPAPPRKPARDPKAPHGLDDDGKPLAPYGTKADGTPRLHPAGPGRPKETDKPRVTETAPPSAPGAGAKGGADYTDDLMNLGMSVWVGASSLKGGRLWVLPVPDCRPYAAVWHAQLPQTVAAWNAAAQQNATVRGYVEKLSGDGSWSWMIGVAVASAGLAAAFTEIAKAPPEVRGQLAAHNDQEMQKFIAAQVHAAGLQEAA